MEVFVLTTGQHAYEDNVTVVGVFSSKENAEAHVKETNPDLQPFYSNFKYGQYWYYIDSFILDQ